MPLVDERTGSSGPHFQAGQASQASDAACDDLTDGRSEDLGRDPRPIRQGLLFEVSTQAKPLLSAEEQATAWTEAFGAY